MRLPLLPVIILILLNLLVDSYIYGLCRRRFSSPLPARIQMWSAAALTVLLMVAVCLPRRGGDNTMLLTVMWMLFTYLSVYIGKYLFVILDLLGRLPRLFGRHRWRFMSGIGIVAGAALFVAMWWGALVNRFDTDTREITVAIPGLPSQFEGYRMVQISDLHTGTYGGSDSFIRKVAHEVNALKPDIILFTGDIVNSRSAEIDPHLQALALFHAPDGVYAILGNHDYGDYADWPSPAAKEESRAHLRDAIRSIGWHLLLNETRMLHRGNDSIALIGVENIGDPPFPVYGSLSAAYPTPADSIVKILLTHNPAHWVDSIAGHGDMNIPLTLSGHTHAMQMEVGGLSPAVLRYPTWGGLYADTDSARQLYVNIGLGTVGFPARIGATPEITVITLTNKDSQAQH